MSHVTPYAARKLVNAELVRRGIKPIAQPMMYNYTSVKINNGEKPLIDFNLEKGGVNVDEDDKTWSGKPNLTEWLVRYINKKTVAATPALIVRVETDADTEDEDEVDEVDAS